MLWKTFFSRHQGTKTLRKKISKILQVLEIKRLLMAICLCHRHGRMECWTTEILRVRTEINDLNCQNFFKPITPSFHYSNWGEAPKFYILRVLVSWWQIFICSGLSGLGIALFFYEVDSFLSFMVIPMAFN